MLKGSYVLKNRIEVLSYGPNLRNNRAAASLAAARAAGYEPGAKLCSEDALAARSLVDERVASGDAAKRAARLQTL